MAESLLQKETFDMNRHIKGVLNLTRRSKPLQMCKTIRKKNVKQPIAPRYALIFLKEQRLENGIKMETLLFIKATKKGPLFKTIRSIANSIFEEAISIS